MLLTLSGRIQTRVFVLAVVGGIVTLLITPFLPGNIPYASTYTILVAVIVLGIVWEFVYHALQQFRWEKDWPSLFGLLTVLNEGLVVWVLLILGLRNPLRMCMAGGVAVG
jgi:hypothetical protein